MAAPGRGVRAAPTVPSAADSVPLPGVAKTWHSWQVQGVLGDVDAPENPELPSCPNLECSEGTMWGFSTGAPLALSPPVWGSRMGEHWSSSRRVNRELW